MNLADLSIGEFTEKTASGTPVPGGGSVAALCGAISAGLAEMVANLTIGKKGYDSAEGEIIRIRREAGKIREKLIADIDADSNAYNGVLAAFRLPKETDIERQARNRAVQNAFKTAATVPLGVAENAAALMELAASAIKYGNKNAVTDAAVAVMTARTAALSAICNVKINLGSIKDERFVRETAEKAEQIERQVTARETEILSGIRL